MRILILLFFLLPFAAKSQSKEIKQRAEHFKSRPIFVSLLTLDQQKVEKLSIEQRTAVEGELKEFNSNLKKAFETFWNASSSINFVPDQKEHAQKKKECKDCLFFELRIQATYKGDDGSTIPVVAYALSSPKKGTYLNHVSPRPGDNKSLVSIITEIRLLQINLTEGDVINKRELGYRTILLNKEERRNKLGQSYVNTILANYGEHVMEVDTAFLLDALMRGDPQYIYLNNASTINVEDGRVIPLM